MNALPLRQPSPGPLLTATDRQRLNKAVVRIVVERCGVMLISADESLLAHHAQILQEMLRRDSSLQVSTMEARDESRLLERFNELLGHLTVDQARAAVLPPGAGHVWILSVQSAEQFAVAKTLARMVHDFPGSNLSLVLLIEPEWAQALAKTRPRMLRSLHRSLRQRLRSAQAPRPLRRCLINRSRPRPWLRPPRPVACPMPQAVIWVSAWQRRRSG